MIYLIIGPSNSGKTTLVYNTFVRDSKVVECYRDIVKVTRTDTSYIIGDFTGESRRKGTDTLARADIKYIYDEVRKLVDSGLDIVLEGVRVCSRPLINQLMSLGELRLIYLYCDVDLSIKRNLAYDKDSNVSYRAMKAACTTANNIYEEYKYTIPNVKIDTSNVDFSEFSLAGVSYSVVHKSKLW